MKIGITNKNFCSRVSEIKAYQEEIDVLKDKLNTKLRENNKIDVENMLKGIEVEELNVKNNTIYFKCGKHTVNKNIIVQCQFTSKKSSDMKSHKKRLHPKFKCPFCQGIFSFVYSTEHLNSSHMDKVHIWAPSKTMGPPFSNSSI